MNKKLIIIIGVFLLISLVSVGCNELSANLYNEEKLVIAVSIVPEATFIREIARDKVDIVTMIPEGFSPANYEPSVKTLQKASKAKLYFSIGVPAEKDILRKLCSINEDVEEISLMDVVKKSNGLLYFSEDSADPHTWMSPKRVIKMVEVIAEKLALLDEKNRDFYKKNSIEYKDRLIALDSKFNKGLEELEQKSFLIYHPSLGYLAKDYGLKMITVQKQGKEADINQLRDIIEYSKENNIKAIIYQVESYNSQVSVLAREIGALAYEINPLSGDYIKSMNNILDFLTNVN